MKRRGEREKEKERERNGKRNRERFPRCGKERRGEERREECVQGKILPGYDASDNYWPRLFLALPSFIPLGRRIKVGKFSIRRGGKMIIGNEIVPRVLSGGSSLPEEKERKERKERKKEKDNHRGSTSFSN